ncbi:aminotransferase class I/II-fold pyridoxal phosphate-dependent enzyme [Pacificimonas sp. WHA3]|uniref:Aminotransferase class I/II-fold pyridoxal phosphate-dependent enzyme n=1 Tax=Pacificimonas pallii TaxID=2827236 RepID=A0ABS6SBP6_9SPHN|nr:aminotransferase class I/II-fold pyridoxal phosphate-dependent enzyme [Pacificimonas pallii]MBV7255302.1 aminotransferase class I/II-fold pyridoxal phosphate-dependent enzyme [Pacificimonas pallii]
MPIEAESPEQFGYDKIRYNLAESSVSDRHLSEFEIDLSQQLLCYGDHIGHPGLRGLVARAAGEPLGAGDVLITSGAASALFIIASSLLERGDHMIVVRPNYATNIETPRAIGCDVSFLDLDFDQGFALDVKRLAKLIRPETKLVSVTTPHNPTGVCLDRAQIEAILALLEKTDARLLVDETYADMGKGAFDPSAATLSPRVIAVSSLSKSYGIPGIRIGWIINSDPDLMHVFLCAKEQISICGSVIDEEVAYQAYSAREKWIPENNRRIDTALAHVRDWVTQEDAVEWIEPVGGCVCFPRIAPNAGIDIEIFYRKLNQDHGTYVGPGSWFEMPRNYFRIGFAWPGLDELDGGLENISSAIANSRG